VAVEHDLVERILSPVVDNAARHARTCVQIGIERDGDAVLFTVQDDGAGVPAEARETIFQPGRRARSASSTTTALASTGAGLGLALCRRLARSAGGDVTLQPSDTGARFVVRLPAG
jgi:signal transduction histidine kinase